MTETTTRPDRPTQPQELRDLIDMHNASQAAANGALRGQVAEALVQTPLDFRSDVSEAFRRFTAEATEWRELIIAWYATPEGTAFQHQVEAWNEYVAAERNRRIGERQARVNVREVTAVRSAACPRCLATHAGEC